MTLTRKNAMEMYKQEMSKLDLMFEYTEDDIQNIKREVKEYGWYYTAVDYNSYIITIKYIVKKS